MLKSQQRIRAIQAYYSEIGLAETFKSMYESGFNPEQDYDYKAKAEQHYRSAERLADYIAIQYKADIDELPPMYNLLKSMEELINEDNK